MPYEISVTEIAEAQLRALTAREQRIVEEGIASRLVSQPTTTSRALKKLRPNPLAGYELRLGNLRVLYNVDEAKSEVVILIVGHKVGNRLIVAGEEFHGHEDYPTA
ncbi:MAG: addiction module toxin RelE [Planctomycetia bacterium]|nr:addiction module toxin RelE [Planctomycetia bacterium]